MFFSDFDSWREQRLREMRRDRKYWLRNMILYIICVLLDAACVVLYTIKALAAVSLWAWVSPVLWFICAICWIALAIMAGREAKKARRAIEEYEKENEDV